VKKVEGRRKKIQKKRGNLVYPGVFPQPAGDRWLWVDTWIDQAAHFFF
jgi:quinol monooxygenase YgiN